MSARESVYKSPRLVLSIAQGRTYNLPIPVALPYQQQQQQYVTANLGMDAQPCDSALVPQQVCWLHMQYVTFLHLLLASAAVFS